MAGHQLLSCGLIVRSITEHIHIAADRSAFARTCRRTHTIANAVLYRSIDTTRLTGFAVDPLAQRRIRLLVKTLEHQARLAKNVRNLRTAPIPANLVTRLIYACVSLRSLHWDIEGVPSTSPTRIARLRASNDLPTLPPASRNIEALAITQYILDTSSPRELVARLAATSNITTLSLYAMWQTAREILPIFGPRLSKLRLEMWNANDLSAQTFERLLNTLVNLQHLQIRSFKATFFREVALPASLSKLTIEKADLGSLQAMCERLADLQWCPKMKRLPTIRCVLPIHGQRVSRAGIDAIMDEFIVVCREAQIACLMRPAWQNITDAFKILVERVQRARFTSRPLRAGNWATMSIAV